MLFGQLSIRMKKRLHCSYGWNLDEFHDGKVESGPMRDERTGGRMNGYMGRKRVFNRIRAAHGMAAIFLFVALFSGKGWGGSLAIRSDPPGAQVFINGTNLGRATPAAIRIRDLPVGRTVIAVEKEGYLSVPPSQEVVVEWSHGNIRFSWWPPVLIKNLAGNRWRGITSPRSRRLEVFRLVDTHLASREVGAQSQTASPSVAPVAKTPPEPNSAVRSVERPSKSRRVKSSISCSVKIEDDPALGNAILGNSDGRVQKGEAFDLVVEVANSSTSTAKSVTCAVTLPGNTPLKTFSELHQAVENLASEASVTFRYNMTLPLNAEIAKSPHCAIEVKSGDSPAECFDFMLPLDLQ